MTTPQKYPENGYWSYTFGECGSLADSLSEAINEVSNYIEGEMPEWIYDAFDGTLPELQERAKQELKKKFAAIKHECLTTGSASGEDWSIWNEGDESEIGEVAK